YPPIVSEHALVANLPVTIDGDGGPITALPVMLEHGPIAAFGFRFGDVFYSPDISGMPAEAENALTGLDLWIVDALRYLPHPSHYSLDEAVAAVERIGAKRAIVTHMHADLDYEAVRSRLP